MPVLAALGLLLVVDPFLRQQHIGVSDLIFDVLITVVLLASVWAATHTRRQLYTALLLAVPAGVFVWAGYVSDATAVVAVGLVFRLLFFGFTTYLVLALVTSAKRISVDTLAGGVAGYLLLGVAWAHLFGLVELLAPSSFEEGGASILGAERPVATLIYFSFVTLSTLGYGDITPQTPPARSLAALAAISGQLYIAILIAALVARYLAEKSRDGAG